MQEKHINEFTGCGIIIQARMSSSRFPGKMLASIAEKPLVEYVYRRCRSSKIKNLILATSDASSDDPIYEYCTGHNIPIVRGDLNNVLTRYIKAAESQGVEYICRVCGDTPFVDTSLMELSLKELISQRLDYVAPDRNTCASGFYVETVTLAALKKIAAMTKDDRDLEHVTKYILDNRGDFSIKLVDANLNPDILKDTRFTIDYPEDMILGNRIAARLADDYSFTSQDVIEIIKSIKETQGYVRHSRI